MTLLTIDPLTAINDQIRARLAELTTAAISDEELSHRLDELGRLQGLILDLLKYEIDDIEARA